LLDKTLCSVDIVSEEIFKKMWEPPPNSDTWRAEWSKFCTEDFKFKNDPWTSLLSATFCLVYVNWHTFLCVSKKLQYEDVRVNSSGTTIHSYTHSIINKCSTLFATSCCKCKYQHAWSWLETEWSFSFSYMLTHIHCLRHWEKDLYKKEKL
jgi:hypothetical protein